MAQLPDTWPSAELPPQSSSWAPTHHRGIRAPVSKFQRGLASVADRRSHIGAAAASSRSAVGMLAGVALVPLRHWRQKAKRRRAAMHQRDQMSSRVETPTKVLEYSRYLRPAPRMSAGDWWTSVTEIPRSRVLWRIRHPLFSMTLFALLVSAGHCLLGIPGISLLGAHTLLGSGLSLLLVFRTNSAYQRFYEGRLIWNDILDLCRDITLTMSLFRKEAGPKRIRIIRTSLQAFPFVMEEHIRSNETAYMHERRSQLLEELQEAKIQFDKKKFGRGTSKATKNRPLRIISRLLKVIGSIKNQGEVFTNRERVWLLSMVNKLSHTVGRCERLVQTPVPRSYARHTFRFLSVWTFTLPLALVGSLRWLTAPVTFVVAWALFGILEIGPS